MRLRRPLLLPLLLLLAACLCCLAPAPAESIPSNFFYKQLQQPFLTHEQYQAAWKDAARLGIIAELKGASIDARLRPSSDSDADGDDDDDFPHELRYEKKADSVSPFAQQGFSKALTSVKTLGRDVLAHLIAPLSIDDFLSEFWESRPLIIRRNNTNYYDQMTTLDKVFRYAHTGQLFHGDTINCARYIDGRRDTWGVPEKRPSMEAPDRSKLIKATESQLRNLFKEGWTLQVPKPYPYVDEIYGLVRKLEDYFDQVVSANIYATPPGTQGFAAHHDATEIFIMQLEGTKRWQVWAPHYLDDQLTPQAKTGYKTSEMKPPVFNITLYPGDLLYFPRGFIHQAQSSETHHSLHITMSPQPNPVTVSDVLYATLPKLVLKAHYAHPHFRYTLPPSFLSRTPEMKAHIKTQVRDYLSRLVEQMDVDDIIEAAGGLLMHSVLQPVEVDPALGLGTFSLITQGQKGHSSHQQQQPDIHIRDDTVLVLTTPKAAVISARDDRSFALHYCTENVRTRFEKDPAPMGFPKFLRNVVEYLVHENRTQPFTAGSIPLNVAPLPHPLFFVVSENIAPHMQYLGTGQFYTAEEEARFLRTWALAKEEVIPTRDRDRVLNMLIRGNVLKVLSVSPLELAKIKARERGDPIEIEATSHREQEQPPVQAPPAEAPPAEAPTKVPTGQQATKKEGVEPMPGSVHDDL